MKALILAGGFGTRLRPLTYTRPKHLLPVANVPHVEHVLDLVQRSGVDEIVLLTSYLAEAFAGTVETARGRGLTVHVTHEQEPLGTAGALKNAEEVIGGERFIAFNGDVLTDVDLGTLVRWHEERGAEATILLTEVHDPSAFGVVPTDASGRVSGFIEKPPPGTAPTNMINAGVYVMEPDVLRRIPRAEVWSAERRLFPEIVDAEGLYAVALPAYWMDVGTPEKYLQANLDALDGTFASRAAGGRSHNGSVVGEGAQIAADARISSSCVGAGCVIGSGASIDRSVLLPGVEIGEGAFVSGSVLGAGAKVSPGRRVEATTSGDQEVLD